MEERNIKSFEDLNSWKRSRQLRIAISQLIKTFPDHEKYDLVSQMRRWSRFVTYNIAEGYGRFNFKENAQYIRISRGSIYELLDQLIVAYDEGYITQNELENKKNDRTDIKIIKWFYQISNGAR
jgi:four helix bundle protein